jgi:uncharacterized membrane protein
MTDGNATAGRWIRIAGIFFLSVWLLGMIPPILEAISIDLPSEWIRALYGVICHGISDRCPLIAGARTALCYRCSAIYFAVFTACILVYPLAGGRLKLRLTLILAASASSVLAIEWLLEYLELIPSSAILQAVSGFMWGLSMGVLLCSAISHFIVGRNTGSEEISD